MSNDIFSKLLPSMMLQEDNQNQMYPCPCSDANYVCICCQAIEEPPRHMITKDYPIYKCQHCGANRTQNKNKNTNTNKTIELDEKMNLNTAFETKPDAIWIKFQCEEGFTADNYIIPVEWLVTHGFSLHQILKDIQQQSVSNGYVQTLNTETTLDKLQEWYSSDSVVTNDYCDKYNLIRIPILLSTS